MVKKSNKSKSKASLQRRWFASATGWGFHLSLGSGVNQTQGSKGKRAVDASLDSQIFHNTTNTSMTHDSLYVFNPLAGITQGTTTSNRLADRIFIENISLRNLATSVNSTNPLNTHSFRIMIVASTADLINTVWTTAGTITLANVFRQYGSNNVIALPDPQLVRVLCDEVITIGSTAVGQQTQAVVNLDCPVNEWFEYQPGTALGVAANLYCLCVPNEANGIIGSTIVGQLYTDYAVVFHN